MIKIIRNTIIFYFCGHFVGFCFHLFVVRGHKNLRKRTELHPIFKYRRKSQTLANCVTGSVFGLYGCIFVGISNRFGIKLRLYRSISGRTRSATSLATKIIAMSGRANVLCINSSILATGVSGTNHKKKCQFMFYIICAKLTRIYDHIILSMVGAESCIANASQQKPDASLLYICRNSCEI